MALTLQQILTLSSSSTPALLAASYGSDNGTISYGRPQDTLVMVEATRANGSAMTAVKYRISVSRTGSAGTWIPVLSVRIGDVNGTPAYEHTISISNNSTTCDGLQTENPLLWPCLLVEAKAVTADAVAGDAANAWIWK